MFACIVVFFGVVVPMFCFGNVFCWRRISLVCQSSIVFGFRCQFVVVGGCRLGFVGCCGMPRFCVTTSGSRCPKWLGLAFVSNVESIVVIVFVGGTRPG